MIVRHGQMSLLGAKVCVAHSVSCTASRAQCPVPVQQDNNRWECHLKRGVHTLKKAEYELVFVQTPGQLPPHLLPTGAGPRPIGNGHSTLWLMPDGHAGAKDIRVVV